RRGAADLCRGQQRVPGETRRRAVGTGEELGRFHPRRAGPDGSREITPRGAEAHGRGELRRLRPSAGAAPQTDRSGPVLGRGPTPSKPRTGSMKAPSDAAGPSAVSASLRGDGGQDAAYDHHPVEPRQRIEVGDVAAAQGGKLKPGETRVALHLR